MITDVLERNLALIRKNKKHKLNIPSTKYDNNADFFRNLNNELTCRITKDNMTFLMHSKYNVMKEAQRFIDNQLSQYQMDLIRKIVVYGFGCGHHIKYLLNIVENLDVVIEIWETNVKFFLSSMAYEDYAEIITNRKINLVITENLTEFVGSSKEFDASTAVIVHEPSLKNIPSQLEAFKLTLDFFKTKTSNLKSAKDLLLLNYKINRTIKADSIDALVGQFKNVPVILVSAGPSLEKNIHLLNRAKEHAFICCVGTALKYLIKHNISPDFFCISDPSDFVYNQIIGVENLTIPLFFLSTVNSNVPKNYQGPKRIIYQEDFDHHFFHRKGVKTNSLLRTGGSVATLLFDLVIKMGFSPICLVGQDLAFTNAKSHFRGAHAFSEIDVKNNNNLYKVKNFYEDGYVYTPKNLYSYLRWFEWIAHEEKSVFYNATEGGAYINGFTHLSLRSFIEKIKHHNIENHRQNFITKFLNA
ncbi:motility associated factor glycosyltransferase family protein [Bacillota bacterium Lsc_1132]